MAIGIDDVLPGRVLRIDWQKPLAQAMHSCYILSAQRSPQGPATTGVLRDIAEWNKHDGFPINAPVWTGRHGGGLRFDGVDDNYSLTTKAFIAPNGASFLIGAAAYSLPTTVDMRILSKASTSAESGHYWMVGHTFDGTNHRLRYRLKNTGGTTTTFVADANGGIGLNEFFHVAVVVDDQASNFASIYKDGVFANGTNLLGQLTQDATVTARIGCNGNSTSFWDGMIAYVYLIARELTQEELFQIARAPYSSILWYPKIQMLRPPAAGGLAVTGIGAIPSAEAFGATTVRLNVTSVGAIPTAEAFGATTLRLNITAIGAIPTAEAFGATVLRLNVSAVGAVPSAEAFGATSLKLGISAIGQIPTAEAFGTSIIRFNVAAIGAVPSAEAFGATILRLAVTAIGAIPTSEAFGTTTVTSGLTVTGIGAIPTTEAFGASIVRLNVTATGAIPSAEAFGATTLKLNVSAIGQIPSAEAFGATTIRLNVLAVGAIPSAEAFGNTTITSGLSVTGIGQIPSAEAFGATRLRLNLASIGAVPSAEAFGGTALKLNLTAIGQVPSAEAFGVTTLRLNVSAVGAIPSGEAFGTTTLAGTQTVSGVGGIASAEVFGVTTLTTGPIVAPTVTLKGLFDLTATLKGLFDLTATLKGGWEVPEFAQNVKMVAGDHQVIKVEVKDATGAAYNVSSGTLNVRERDAAGAVKVTKPATVAANVMTFSFLPADTQTMRVDSYHLQAEAVDAASNKRTTTLGRLEVVADAIP